MVCVCLLLQYKAFVGKDVPVGLVGEAPDTCPSASHWGLGERERDYNASGSVKTVIVKENELHVAQVSALRNHVRFSLMPAEPDWKVPHTSTTCCSASPIHLDLDPRSSTEDLTASANPNLNGIDPARAKWSERYPVKPVSGASRWQSVSACIPSMLCATLHASMRSCSLWD